MPRLFRLRAVSIALVAACFVSCTGPLIAEPLQRLVTQLPPTVGVSGIVFSYLRRTAELERDFAARVLVTDFDGDLVAALAKPDAGSRIAGVEFARVETALQAGIPTSGILVLTGVPGVADAAPAALKARGYKVQSDPGRPVCAYTDPNDLDEERPNISPEDPLAGGGARAYCLAALGDRVIVAPDRPSMRDAVARNAAPLACPLCKTFSAMIAAASTSRGGQGEIISALGSTLTAHVGTGALHEIMGGLGSGSSLEEIRKRLAAETAKTPRPIPPHLFAVMSAARSSDAEAAQITLLYADRSQAETAAAAIRQRLAAFPRAAGYAAPGTIDLAYHAGEGGTAIAVLTLRYLRDDRRSGLMELSSWIAAMQQSGFTVLDPTR